MIVKRQEEKNKQNYADFRIIAEKKNQENKNSNKTRSKSRTNIAEERLLVIGIKETEECR